MDRIVSNITDFRTARDLAVPGDYITLTDGTYATLSEVLVGPASPHGGTAGNPITIRAQNRHGAVVRPSSTTHSQTFKSRSSVSDASSFATATGYITIDGLWFDGRTVGNANATYGTASSPILFSEWDHHITVQNCRIQHHYGGGLTNQCSDYFSFLNNDVWRNGDNVNNTGAGSGSPQNCRNGVHLYDSTAGFHNLFLNNRYGGNCDGSAATDGNAVILDRGDHAATYSGQGLTLVANNLAYMQGGRGFNSLCISNFWFVHNTLYGNGLKKANTGCHEVVLESCDNAFVVNNIVYSWAGANASGTKRYCLVQSGSSADSATDIVYKRNIFYGGDTTRSATANTNNVPVGIYGNANALHWVDPLFNSPISLNATADLQFLNAPAPWNLGTALQLQVGSPAVSAAWDPRVLTSDNTIKSNLLTHCGTDYDGTTRTWVTA